MIYELRNITKEIKSLLKCLLSVTPSRDITEIFSWSNLYVFQIGGSKSLIKGFFNYYSDLEYDYQVLLPNEYYQNLWAEYIQNTPLIYRCFLESCWSLIRWSNCDNEYTSEYYFIKSYRTDDIQINLLG